MGGRIPDDRAFVKTVLSIYLEERVATFQAAMKKTALLLETHRKNCLPTDALLNPSLPGQNSSYKLLSVNAIKSFLPCVYGTLVPSIAPRVLAP